MPTRSAVRALNDSPASSRPVDDAGHYTRTAIAFHWLMALLIVVGFSIGWYMSDLGPSPTRGSLINVHKSIGVTILGLAAGRLLWRLWHRPPAFPSYVASWQRGVAHLVHGLLYILFFAVPLVGWAMSSAGGHTVVYLGVLPLPDLVSPDKALAHTLGTLHAWFAYSLAVIVLLHVAAALRHGFEDPIAYLKRMLASRTSAAPRS